MSGPAIERKRLVVTGVVQAVGFRPWVWRRARRHGLSGWVENDTGGVIAEIQGPAAAVSAFLDGFVASAPPLARVAGVVVTGITVDASEPGPFVILESTDRPGATTAIPPDVGPCASCLAEVRDPGNRRHRHPFANCTDCGPRATIVTGLPWDRSRTTMRGFRLCADCAREYDDPADRRFHAQPLACPACGPTVWLETADGRRTAAADAAILAVRASLRAGAIVAIKGVGGFHLACDGTSDAAVLRLRQRKERGGKPLALLVADLDAARRIGRIGPLEERLLAGPERPIVLVRAGGGGVSRQVAPGLGWLGVMLPPSPLHWLLAEGMPPLVLTSGNLAEEPICHRDADARRVLGPLVDALLFHDRPIEAPCDDSVVRCVAGAVLPIRRARGHCPLPIPFPGTARAVLAVGGEGKAAPCVSDGRRAIMGPHVGDMGHADTIDALERSARRLLDLFRIEPRAVAADLHPGYLSTDLARRMAASLGIRLVPVQHHEAHVAALVAEHGHEGRPLIGVCFDGTGYGRDGTIQGGEFLLYGGGDRSSASTGGSPMVRAAHLDPFPLPGGDASVRHPWRTACALLHAAGVPADARPTSLDAVDPREVALLERLLERSVGCTPTSSMGRLFDGVAALVGVARSIGYEAEAAMKLETLALRSADSGAYAFGVVAGRPRRVDWRPVVRAVVDDVRAGVPEAVVAARFHRAVAEMIGTVCEGLRADGAGDVAGLTGGVFQNAFLVERSLEALERRGFQVLLHRLVPPNDGGLALGQALLAGGT